MKRLRCFWLSCLIIGIILTYAGCAKTTTGSNDTSQNVEADTTAGETNSTQATKTEFAIGSETIKLEELSLLSDKVSIFIPDSFDVMSDEMAKLKYPNEQRPTLIYTNDSASVNIAFSYTESKATEKQINDYLETFKQSFKNLYPSAEWYDTGVVEINTKKLGYIELLTPAIDSEIYNLMWFTDLDGRLLITTFNCTKEQMDDWKPVAKSIMNSQQYFKNSNIIEVPNDNPSVFKVVDYPINVTCPAGWWQDEAGNFDFKTWNKDSSLAMSIFCNYEMDLPEGMSKQDYFDAQNQQLLDKRSNVTLTEEMTEWQYEDHTITSILYTAESGGTKNFYYFSLVSLEDSDCFVWVLFNGMPSDFKTNRDTMNGILQSIEFIKS